MTKNEAIARMRYRIDTATDIVGKGSGGKAYEDMEIAIKALEEIQQYRVIGTVEEIKEILQIVSEGQDDVDESGISTGLLHTLLEYTEYKKIGTVEECREAREKQRGKKPVYRSIFTDGTRLLGCPVCFSRIDGGAFYCNGCGQKLDWSE